MYQNVHRNYVTKLAGFANECGVKHMLIVSSQGANSSSMFAYLKLKGQVVIIFDYYHDIVTQFIF